jgi:hypothetical protein
MSQTKIRNTRNQTTLRNFLHFDTLLHSVCYAPIPAGSLLVFGVEKMIEKWIESLKNGQCIPESDLKKLCSMVSSDNRTDFVEMTILAQVKEILMEEANVQPVQSPVTV